MARVSELLDRQPEDDAASRNSRTRVVEAAQAGEIHLYMDIKPEFPDTPRNWEQELEIAFYSGRAACAVTNSVKTRLTTIAAPYGREVRLDDVAYPSGMRLLRVTIREGARDTRSGDRRGDGARVGGRNARLGQTRARRADLSLARRGRIEPPP